MKPTITANEVVNLLAARHANDIFVPECKGGPTWGGTHERMDAWTMNRSWTSLKFTGYEIKVSRADWLQDNKWHSYLEFCNSFYIVAPDGVIKEEELPPEVGWLRVAKNGKRLITKKKAPHRQVEIPESLFVYILMSRVQVTRERQEHVGWRKQYWQEWLKEKKIDRNLGYRVGKAMSKRIQEEVIKAKEENEILVAENAELRTVKEWAEENNIRLDSYSLKTNLARALEEKQAGMSKQFIRDVNSALRTLTNLKETFEQ